MAITVCESQTFLRWGPEHNERQHEPGFAILEFTSPEFTIVEFGLARFLESCAAVRVQRLRPESKPVARNGGAFAGRAHALEAQREAGRAKNQSRKRIGAWLQELGFSTEQQVTAALARQWSCPVLRAPPMEIAARRFPSIPILLLESFQMIPVELVEANGTLLMAFSEGIDYTILYAIERMLGYHTEACLVCPSALQKSLQALAGRRGQSDVVFDRIDDAGECARIIVNYSAKVQAEEVRVARCGEHLWIRLERLRQEAVTLVLRAPISSSQFPVLSSQFSVL